MSQHDSTAVADVGRPHLRPPIERLSLGELGEPFEEVRSIAVLRGGGLGDFLFSLAAIESLAAAYPAARITLLGTPLHAALLQGRPGVIDEVEVLPVSRGVRDVPGSAEDELETTRFLDRMRRRRFDLAVQLHGGGRYSNPFLLRLGARHTVGTRTPDAAGLERDLPYVYYQHEMLRALEVVGLAGAAPVRLEPRIHVTHEERTAAARHIDAEAPLVLLHPGATDPRRRWPNANFAEVAGRLAGEGAQVVVIGDETDAASAREIVELAASSRVSSLAGELPLGEAAGLMSLADVLVGNDSGPRHLAQAVGTSTVGIYWFPNLINAGPLGRADHRPHVAWTMACPTCGRDVTQVGWTAERCEHDDSFVADVAPEPVAADAADLMARSLLRRGR
ncbi:glycosyltransferase family 9 protein [Salinibacterium sp. SYSU T00001]|uniref:glycosyltransferase family 9 protein n=1 Tax=Homoserinimonas sedimenticola TaxID=2986805 RepID=UPI0022360E8D|nr:glycosyltransferase family 9 protein [Salinibacterium sedimenticola]MCW4385599.1 glycosyltransferase family 9 protein [Salinibacterium sedimenticola]